MTHLSTLPIVLVLASKPHPIQPLEHILHALRRLGQHGRHGNAWRQRARLVHLLQRHSEQGVEEGIVGGYLHVGLFDDVRGGFEGDFEWEGFGGA